MSAEELRASLEKEVRRRLKEHIEVLQEEFERLRIESRQRWEEFSDRFDFPIPQLVPGELIPEPPPPAAAPAAADLAGLRADLLAMDRATTQVDTLREFLAACRQHADRVLILIRKGDQLTVWKSEGFSAPDDAALRALSLKENDEPALAAALGGEPLLLPAGCRINSRLRAGDAAEAALVPIVVRESVAAVLYADRRPGGEALAPDALALLGYMVGIAIDRLATRRVTPAPALSPFRRWEAEPSAATVAFPRVESAPAAETEVEELAYGEAVEIPEPEAEAVEEAPPPPEPPPPAAIPPPPPPPPAPRASAPDAEATAVGVRPPAGLPPPRPGMLRGPLAASSEDPHDEARRVARLLVSDILLYNEAAVVEGRKHNDVYDRLKDDIERARQTYNERVPESVRRTTNYFHEELIHALAGESPEAPGS